MNGITAEKSENIPSSDKEESVSVPEIDRLVSNACNIKEVGTPTNNVVFMKHQTIQEIIPDTVATTTTATITSVFPDISSVVLPAIPDSSDRAASISKRKRPSTSQSTKKKVKTTATNIKKNNMVPATTKVLIDLTSGKISVLNKIFQIC